MKVEWSIRMRAADPSGLPSELPAYLTALAPLIPRRKLAVDAGTGAGVVLDVLAPIFEQVVAIDRERGLRARYGFITNAPRTYGATFRKEF